MIYEGVEGVCVCKKHMYIHIDSGIIYCCLFGLYKQHWSCPVFPVCYSDWEQLSVSVSDLARRGGATGTAAESPTHC